KNGMALMLVQPGGWRTLLHLARGPKLKPNSSGGILGGPQASLRPLVLCLPLAVLVIRQPHIAVESDPLIGAEWEPFAAPPLLNPVGRGCGLVRTLVGFRCASLLFALSVPSEESTELLRGA